MDSVKVLFPSEPEDSLRSMLEEAGYDVSKVIASMMERNSLANSLPTTQVLPGNSILETSTGSGSSSLFLSSSVKTSSLSSGSVLGESSSVGSRVEHMPAKTVPTENTSLDSGQGRNRVVGNVDPGRTLHSSNVFDHVTDRLGCEKPGVDIDAASGGGAASSGE